MHSNKLRWFFTCLLLAALGATALFASPPMDVMEKPRMEKMLNDGDVGMVVQIFRRFPGRTLPYVDQYFEGGLARIEKGEHPANVLDQYRTGILFAELADKAFGVSVFTEYANAFASWSPTEQKNFREGQRAFKEGLKDPNSAAGRESLQRSLQLAESLGDLWGQAMAISALAEAELIAGESSAALSMAMQAVELNAKLQLKEDCARSFVTAARAAMKVDQLVSAASYQSQAWAQIEKSQDIDPKFRQQVLEETIAILEKSGMKDQASQLRQKHGIATGDSNSPQTQPASEN